MTRIERSLEVLAPYWHEVLADEGLTCPDDASVRLWLASQRGTVRPEFKEMLWRRAGGESAGQIARDVGRVRGQVRDVVRRTGLRLIVPHLADLERWHRARRAWEWDAVIAERAGVPTLLVSLALDGLPDVPRWSDAQVTAAHRRWAAGDPLVEVAGELDLSRDRLMRHLADGTISLRGERLYAASVVAQLGWTQSTLGKHLSAGHFARPDGRDAGRRWWWASTVERWIEDSDLPWCEDCSMVFVAQKGLRAHRTRKHCGRRT